MAGCAALAGCDIYFFVCDEADQQALAQLPPRLSDTGLFDDIAANTVAPDVLAYSPQFELWSDGATKRRWIRLPDGAQIDTSDMDSWSFPVGTRLWKEFSRESVRLETRLYERVGPQPEDWAAVSYVWDDDETDAVAAPLGFIAARGTSHNVPAASECAGCHGGRRSTILGFSAIQLSFPAAAGELDLDGLVGLDLLSDPPPASFDVPGDATERAALGYLHANCGNCHNSDRPPRSGARCFDPKNELDFWLAVDRLDSPTATPAYESAIGEHVVAGAPDDSELIDRITRRDFIYQMPPLGTEQIDGAGVAVLRRWVSELR